MEVTEVSLHALYKLGSAKNMRRFRELGELRLRSLNYYRGLEHDGERGDGYEGDSVLYQPRHLASIQFGSHVVPPGDLAGPLRLSLHEDRNCAVFCMGSITGPIVDRHFRLSTPLIDERNLAFGDTAVVIKDLDEFFTRLRRAANREGLHCEGRPVEYLSVHAHHGEWGPFRKDIRFSHQQEWRLAVRNQVSDPFFLRLGSLVDCTMQMTSETLIRTVEALRAA